MVRPRRAKDLSRYLDEVVQSTNELDLDISHDIRNIGPSRQRAHRR